ncbi:MULTISPECIES: LPS export ABC transporter permease LptG [Pseudoalteromonas]|jgi:lipopolysaccharide export system permease protein|uniref:LPS export ABC transporter permease LptG n=1 Tax=Pseudoalteromonas TaxID=53246 RepID=UPI000781CA93|nr:MULTISPECIES: LPS export ABC transporter permease LptG [Gammaproteobacteria]MCF7501627.1 LPS export ABC transporter permease LptG [Pseudoalteromonas sp. L1]RZF92497.1 lipopolysaccharide ABC transporter permease LptG [Pseudoalteromonas sp. CO302Y]RZG09190.1 lipopolysaccharide ABC transporter permease LptG [Pseudoalteromonas sp. CO133X]UJX26206.1 LPS export ABC transporter permease LptG [Pseudoalteromonas sp. CF6-2]WOC26992.1 LPS export ABC transporter permease LptG [Pseudoalteromonas sp. N12|tara:strand:+ start:1922 stop:2989 length:1068 start_codon:yes stop_codon:yes gene_type:complete
MMKTLDWYLGRSIIQTTGFALMVLVGISTLIKFIEQLKSVGRGSYDIATALIYTLYSMPGDLVIFFPMAALIGGLTGLGALASNSELVVMQAAGMSRLQIIASVMKTAMFMAICMMALGEWGAPEAQLKAKEIRNHAIYGGDVFSAQQGVWAKDGSNFINIEDVDQQGILRGVHMYHFDKSLQLTQITKAEEAVNRQDGWLLRDVNKVKITPEKITTEQQDEEFYDSQLTAEKLGVVSVKPESLSFTGLWSYLSYLQQNEQDTSTYELALWRKFMQPISIAVMLLVALSFIFGPLRTVTMGARIIMGVITGITFHLTNEIFGPVVMVYQIPAVIGAVLPSILFIGFATYLLNKRV